MNFPTDIKAVIFDMDGTIINTEPLHAQVIEDILHSEKCSTTAQQIEELFYGKSDTEVFEYFKEQLSISLETFLQKKNKKLKELILSQRSDDFEKLLTPGIALFIEKLTEKKIPLALVSASENEIVETIITQLNFKKYFKHLISRQNTFFTKPNPSPYFLALRLLEANTHETLIFEDSPAGLSAALSTKARVIQITAFSPPLNHFACDKIDNYLCFNFQN